MEMRSTVAAIEPHLVYYPGGKHHQPSGSGLHLLFNEVVQSSAWKTNL